MTTATAPLSPEIGRSHLQESLFSWLAPDTTPEPEQKAAPPLEGPAESAPPLEPFYPEEPEAPNLSHVWVVAAEIAVTPKIAKTADYRGSFKATEGLRVDALEVYCRGCRRPYDEVTGQDCAEKIDNRHLIGGDQTTRAKRKIPTPPKKSRLIPGGTIQRRGIGAYMSGVSRPPR
ncbi:MULTISPECIES: hypothetical protein [unclassified Streptomyces]|uniref:hypothetical protein n=1 Tax=unclassified Streptomyces TaxID=2593676 RepID=UPI00225C0D46|nr:MULTISPECIES: hypothetical protein [unclassified Streptomyces]MCX4976455.1 hypothetical protein [Streptomyces sp. NBC_00620]WRZ24325.1 hypothetical protein OHT59_40340 [Streptomyces sp. NBC_00243]